MYNIAWLVAAGFLLDLIFGDPRWMYHPIRMIGNLIAVLEKGIRKICSKDRAGERAGGVLLVILVIVISTGVPMAILMACYALSFWLGVIVEVIMCYQLLATKALRDESMKVYHELETGDIEKSRYAVSMIVGRDTAELEEDGITKATVETIAENASDGVIAPLFFMMIGGAAFGFFYKSINTMDSMVGYKNDKYRYFGTAAAKLDDVVNFIPARLAGWLMILASYLSGMDGKNATKIFKRDRKNHASPNSAQTEAVMAGALDVQLAGNASYFGKVYEKPTIGDPIKPITKEMIPQANKLMYVTAVLTVLIFGAVRIGTTILLTHYL